LKPLGLVVQTLDGKPEVVSLARTLGLKPGSPVWNDFQMCGLVCALQSSGIELPSGLYGVRVGVDAWVRY
jgi:hypothetical protein